MEVISKYFVRKHLVDKRYKETFYIDDEVIMNVYKNDIEMFYKSDKFFKIFNINNCLHS